MKSLCVLCLLFCFSAQEKAQSESPLKIENISWHGAPNDGTLWHNRGAFSIDVKYAGDKIITAVHWDFYLVDSVRDRLYDHFKFVTDDKKIPAGKKIRLTKRFDYPGSTPDYVTAMAKIRKIVYSDGSTWENPAKLD